MDTGTILIIEPTGDPAVPERPLKAAIYTRVSATENKDNLDGQAKRLTDYCAAKGYPIAAIIKAIGSGVNDSRPKLLKLITDPTMTLIVVEHKDRLTRFGFNDIDQLLKMQGGKIEVIRLNNGVAENGKEDLVQDFVSIVTSFCARLYGQRRSKRKTERLIAELTNNHPTPLHSGD